MAKSKKSASKRRKPIKFNRKGQNKDKTGTEMFKFEELEASNNSQLQPSREELQKRPNTKRVRKGFVVPWKKSVKRPNNPTEATVANNLTTATADKNPTVQEPRPPKAKRMIKKFVVPWKKTKPELGADYLPLE